MNRICLFLIIAIISFLFCSSSYGNAIFKISVSQPTIQVDETATIGVWAKIEEQTSGFNGISTWQCDISVGQSGVLQVIDVVIVAPSPRDTGVPIYSSINSPQSGDVTGLGAGNINPAANSSIGVGGFSHLADITVQAIGLGTAEYAVTNASSTGFYVWLRDYFAFGSPGNEYDSAFASPYKAVFEGGNNVINVVPEPATILLLGAASLILRKRKNIQ